MNQTVGRGGRGHGPVVCRARRFPGHRAVGGRYQPPRGRRRVRRNGEGARERLPDPATAAPPGEVEPVEVGGRAHGGTHVPREGQPHLGRGVRVRQTDLVQRHRPAQLRADGRGDQVRGGALRHHPLRHPPGHRRLVVPERQAALRAEVVDPPGQPGVADAREGEDGAELLIGLAELPGHAPPLVTRGTHTPPGHRRPAFRKPSVVPRLPSVKALTSVWRDCCPFAQSAPGPEPGRTSRGVLRPCGRAPARALWPVRGPGDSMCGAWVGPLRGSGGPGDAAASIPAGGGTVRGVEPASRTAPARRAPTPRDGSPGGRRMAESDLWGGGNGTPNTAWQGRVRLRVRPL